MYQSVRVRSSIANHQENMTIGKFLFTVSLFVCSVHAEVPFIEKCLSSDSACLKRSAQAALPVLAAGIPELKIQPLDPLHIDQLDASRAGLKFTSTDVVITGLRNCVIEELQRDTTASKIIVGILCDVDYKSKYEVHGQVLIVPFEGNGDMHVVLPQTYIYVDSDLVKKVDKKGQKHWHIRKYRYEHILRGEPDLDLTNLFEGNEVLGRAARSILKTNAKDVVNEVGPPIMKAIVEKIIRTINQLYHSVDPDDLALDPFPFQ